METNTYITESTPLTLGGGIWSQIGNARTTYSTMSAHEMQRRVYDYMNITTFDGISTYGLSYTSEYNSTNIGQMYEAYLNNRPLVQYGPYEESQTVRYVRCKRDGIRFIPKVIINEEDKI